MHALRIALADGAVIAKRNLIKVKRVPDILVFTIISPIMFVLLFAYVFGNSIDVPGVNYREFLIAGIFAQTVVFGATFTGAGLAEDIQKGIIDRFRSLLDDVTRAGLGVLDVGLRRPTLDDVFLTLTGHTADERAEESDEAEREREVA